MYLFDLFANIFRKKNFGVLIWLIINTVIVTFCFTVIIDIATGSVLDDWLEYLLGFVVYASTMAAALSPIGEAILRWQNGCKKITDDETLSRLSGLFEEVREKSIEFDKSLNRNIRFYMSDDESPNAFATGRKTVCVTKGLLALSDDEIKGVLAHEFGHLSHKDTDVILVIAVGNMFVALGVSVVSLIVRLFNWVIGFVISMSSGSERGGFIIGFLTSKFNALVSLLFGAVLWLWTKLGVVICMSSSRQNEFHADKFAFDIGFGSELKSSLVKLDGGEKIKSKGLWAALSASHPDTNKRIEMLDSYDIAPVKHESNDYTVTDSYKEHENGSANNDRFAMLRGFSSNFERETVKEKYSVAEVKPEKAPESEIIESKSTELPLKFHKANLWFFTPVAIISALVDLITRGINLVNYGISATNILGVLASFAVIMFSVSSLYEFSQRQENAFVSTMVTKAVSLVSCFVVLTETFDTYRLYGFEDSVAIIISTFSLIWAAVFTFLYYMYYEKRKDILFDKKESND